MKIGISLRLQYKDCVVYMNLQEVFQKIESGEIILDENGHDVADRAFRRAGGVRRTAEIGRNWDQEKLDRKVLEGKINYFFNDIKCWRCGERIHHILLGNTFKACTAKHHSDIRIPSTIIENNCEFSEKKPLTGVIRVNSSLLFANYFSHVEDSPDEFKYTDQWSLNYYGGRARITEFKSKHNVAYGQMGNMSVGIFLHPNKKSIIIGNPYIAEHKFDQLCEKLGYEKANQLYDDEKEYEKLGIIDEHKLVGKVSCEIWRWEATERNSLSQEQYDNLVNEHSDIVQVEVEHGNWQFEHYYRTECLQDNETIYARLYKLE